MESSNMKTEWISVKDMVPNNSDRILVYFKHEIRFGSYLYSSIDKREHTFGVYAFGQTTNVTHWMPLPEPPK